MERNIIRFYKGEENGIIAEKGGYESSIFHDQYSQALHLLEDMVVKLSEEKNADGGEDLTPNLIAFCGDRGEGKTSCMCTIREMLVRNTTEGATRDFLLSEAIGAKCLADKKIECLPLVNPAFFDHNHNILELLIGQMYEQFYTIDKDLSPEDSQRLCEKFQKAKLCMKHLDKSRREMFDVLEELDVLAAGVKLREAISELFSVYLEVLKKEFLVVSVDDLDLNMNEAYVMSEQIRKYLCNPQCIVLISVKTDQLIDVVENTISRELVESSGIDVRDMAVKYVDKLLPMGARINMPRVYDLCNKPVEIFTSRKDGKSLGSYPSVRDCVVRLIFTKTRFLFYNSLGGISPVVPNNLRALRHMLGMLIAMPDFDNNIEHGNNKRIFKNYFFNSWVKNLSDELRPIALRLVHNDDLTQTNKLIIESLTSRTRDASSVIPDVISADDGLTGCICNPENYGFNQSTGDVFHLLGILERSSSDDDAQRLLFFIRSYYSILLYDNYDAITEGGINALYPDSAEMVNGEVFKSDKWFNRTNLLQRLINGSYFSYNPADMLNRSKDGNFRDLAIIKGERLRALARNVRDKMSNMNDETEADEDFRRDFRLLEFFFLHILRRMPDGTSDVGSDRFRRLARPAHLQSFNQQTGYYLFDVLGAFSSVVNLKFAYGRFEGLVSLYEFAYSRDWTLLGRMMKLVQLKEARDTDPTRKEWDLEAIDTDEKRHNALMRLISNATLRNAEVISAMTESMKFRAEGIKSSGIRSQLIREFYSSIINSEMKTYQKNAFDGTQYIMRFGFLEAFRELLSEVASDDFESYFSITDVKMTQEDIIKQLFDDVLTSIRKWRTGRTVKSLIMAREDLYGLLPAEDWNNILPDDVTFTKEDLVERLKSVKEWTL